MANAEHVAKLQEGVEAWNAWRDQNPEIQPDFSEADLYGAKLGGAYLGGAKLGRADLSRADLSGADLSWADLSEVGLYEASLRGADLSGANLRGAGLYGADLGEVDLNEAGLYEADLRGADLGGAYLSGAKLGRADLSGAKLAKADLSGADLSGAKLAKADLRWVKLDRANLRGADLSKADLNTASFYAADLCRAKLYEADLSEGRLIEAKLSEADLSGAQLSWANLFGANLGGAGLYGAYLNYANLTEAKLSGADLGRARIQGTTFANVDLTDAKGLESCVHQGPSIIDHRTLEHSGKLPLSFLRGCGLPDTFIDYLPSLLNQPIQHYSCFISYSTKDEALAERLHADLQDKGVRCWFAPEDLKIGDKWRVRIDEAIRTYEKLLLLLSEHSVISTWVEKEVETAFDRENECGELVLFPIRLDTAVMESKTGWAADIRRSRHVGNFCNWKSHDEYQKGLERLLRDLQIEKGE